MDQDTLIIVEPKPMFINFITKDLTCNEYFDGEIEAVITGGNTDPTVFLDGYSYEWRLSLFCCEWTIRLLY